MRTKIVVFLLLIGISLLLLPNKNKNDLFEANVEEGKAIVNINGKVFDMKAKYSSLGMLRLSGGGFVNNDFTIITMGIPKEFGPGIYNNDKDKYDVKKFMLISCNQSGKVFTYDPQQIFKVDVRISGKDYVIKFDGGFLLNGQQLTFFGKIRISKEQFSERIL